MATACLKTPLIALSALVVLASSIAWAGKPEKTHKVTTDGPATAEDFLALGSALLSAHDLDSAEKAFRDGLKQYPAANGFHLKLGEVHAARGDLAEAFYEYQWELLRAGTDRAAGREAAFRTAELMRKANDPEIRAVLVAVKDTQQDPAGALAKLQEVEAKRGPRFALTVYITEAADAAGDTKAAQAGYRTLLEQDGRFVPAYMRLAALLKAEGQTAEAAELEDQARLSDPDHWFFKQARKQP